MTDTHLASASQLMVDERYEEAIEAYGRSIESERSTAALAGRAAAFLKLGQATAALQDASAALAIDSAYEPALYRKGLACFELDEYESAVAALRQGLALAGGPVAERRKYNQWIRKCEAEIEEEEEEEEEEQEAAPQQPPAPMAVGPAVPTSKTIANTIKYQYYQSDSDVTISVLAKNVPEERATVVIEEKTLLVKIVTGEGYEMTVIAGELYDPVVPSECSVRYLPSKIEIKLKKKESFNWNDLLLGDTIGGDKPKKPQALRNKPAVVTGAPTPYASGKNWNAIDREMGEELEKDKPEGEEALNKLFQDIYSKATPETRRAMNKSFQTSGGTVLSTNWTEVEKADYEKDRQAPAGMVWKNWEGEKLPQKEND
ncbi:hypothetical protein CTAYLR_004058 [Chrysophaeum taylorii]|uniref:Uncharacterized protein n=1 Tax=Chrysophaeum taylorii TaxID=2483200 RepID=A0AAD7UP47_9STRA|nr:hypothetical protein CTAYLR_004058 [Chrysophaeum taylorii]